MMRKAVYLIALLGCITALFNSSHTATAQQVINVYMDNRSTAETLIMSYMNAVNRKEYSRAYGYWQDGAAQLAPFPQFVQGYANTQSVQATVGIVSADPGAGQIYYSAPVTLIATITGGALQTFVGCYTLHISQPAIQGVPPFHPLEIVSAQVQQVANDANTAALMAQACQSQNGGQLPPSAPSPIPNPLAIDASQYIDDRSDAVAVLHSLFNAVNRKEYVRAYFYWEVGAAQLAPFPQFEQGYADTQSVWMTAGVVNIDNGAGQIFYSVPVVLVSQMTNTSIQTFVGCYTLHLSQPLIQTEPPYHPLSIFSAQVHQVPNNATPDTLLPQSCQ